MGRKSVATEIYEAPKTLVDHPFYGLTLDEEQMEFVNAIWDPKIDIVFVNSVAGSGKTTLALGTAYLLVQYHIFHNIVYIVNATQERRIGYRPGSTEAKMAPYFMPIYDAASTLGINPYTDISIASDEYCDKGDATITCLSPIFLRGRNIPAGQNMKTVVILDESQNMTVHEMRTALTRMNSGAKVIVIGHDGQCDLEDASKSGFRAFINLFKEDPRCKVCQLTKNYRGWISQKADSIDSFLNSEINEG